MTTHRRLTAENWLDPDPVVNSLGTATPSGVRQMTPQDVAESVLTTDIAGLTQIPDGPRELLLAAQATMAYGGLYYPLLTVGMQLCGRAAEAAVKQRARQVGLSTRLSFKILIDKLDLHGHIEDVAEWHRLRELRNMFSHPEGQDLVPLGLAVPTLNAFVQTIVQLFDDTSPDGLSDHHE